MSDPGSPLGLKWNNRDKLLAENFENFLNDEKMFDVTLACEGKTLKAHKLVLSACSSYFQDMFIDNPCPHPIVILPHLKYEHVQTIIKFIYHGEVFVQPENLPGLFETADVLKIGPLGDVMGLSDPNNPEGSNHPFILLSGNQVTVYQPEAIHQPESVYEPESNPPSPEKKLFFLLDSMEQMSIDENISPVENFVAPASNAAVENLTTTNDQQQLTWEPVEKQLALEQLPPMEAQLAWKQLPPVEEQPACEQQPHVERPVCEQQPHVERPVCEQQTLVEERPVCEQQTLVEERPVCEQPSLEQEQESIVEVIESHTIEKENVLEMASEQISTDNLQVPSSFQSDRNEQPSSSKDSSNVAIIPSLPPAFVVLNDVMLSLPEDEKRRLLNGVSQKKLQKKRKYRKKAKAIPPSLVPASIQILRMKAKVNEVIAASGSVSNKGNSGLPKNFKCDQCSFKTARAQSLKRHIRCRHDNIRKYKCTQCSYAATLKQHLLRHIGDVHDHVELIYKCTLCPYKSAHVGNLKRHFENMHEAKKPFQCNKCNYGTYHKVCLEKHIRGIHDKVRPFTCDFCTYRCAGKDNLRRHLKLMHSGQQKKK